MIKRSLRQSFILACFAIVAAFSFAAPSALSAERPPRRQAAQRVGLIDSGKTIVLSVGQQLVVTLPLQAYADNSWYVAHISGGGLKLIAGPDERRAPNWTPFMNSTQVFYFQRVSPGAAHLVLEQSYYSKPMLLDVVDP